MTASSLHLWVRLSARVAFCIFIVVFATAALQTLWPSRPTKWLRRNRRQLGLVFAAVHFTHLGLVLALSRVDTGPTGPSFDVVTAGGGGLAYLLLAFMTATSFDVTAKAVGKRAWRIGHTAGIWLLWLIFTQSYVGRVRDPAAWPLVAAALAGPLLRVAAWRKRAAKKLARREDLAA